MSIEEVQWAELPPPGIYLRMLSPYLLEVFPLDKLPEDCGGPPATPAPAPGGQQVGGQEFRGESVHVETVNLLTTITAAMPMVQATEIEAPDGYAPGCDPMAPLIQMACAYLSTITCRDFGNGTGTAIPEEMLPLAYFATALYVEQLVFRMDPARRQSAMGGATGGLQSFSAGPYSESYFGPSDASKYAWNVMDPDPLLNSMLLALITPECLQARQDLGDDQDPPGWATQEIDWTWPPGYSGWHDCRGGDWLP